MIGATLSAELIIILAPRPQGSQTSHHTIPYQTFRRPHPTIDNTPGMLNAMSFQITLTKTRKTLRILAFNSRGYSSLATDHPRRHLKGRTSWGMLTGVGTNCDDFKNPQSTNPLTNSSKDCDPSLQPRATAPIGNSHSRFTGSFVPNAPENSTSRPDTCSRCITKTVITITIPRTDRIGKTSAYTATMMNTAGESLVIIYGRRKRTSLRESVYNPLAHEEHMLLTGTN